MSTNSTTILSLTILLSFLIYREFILIIAKAIYFSWLLTSLKLSLHASFNSALENEDLAHFALELQTF